MVVDSIDKQTIANLFKKGKDFEEVKKQFPQYSGQQLAAIKAHVTIGSYKMRKHKMISENDKRIIISLGAKGLNSKEILKKKKWENYSPQQIAGVLAHCS